MEIEVKGKVLVENQTAGYSKVELTKGAKGEYRWSVTVSCPEGYDLLKLIKALNADLEKVYGEGAASHV